MRFSQSPLQHAWHEARAGRGHLVLLAGAGDAPVERAVAELVATATRDGARILGLDVFAATAGFDASAAVAERLRSESARAPQLLVLAHVERAEAAALRLLAFLGRELRDAAVLLVATRGDAERSTDPDRERALADLARAGEWVSLARPAAPPPERTAPLPAVSLGRDGDFWTLERAGHRVVLRDTRGLQHLAELLREPGRARSALELAGRADEDGGEAIDAAARAAYRRALGALHASADTDDAARRDAAFLARTLSRDTGLGGRARRIDSAADRARIAVTRGIRRAIAAVEAQDAELGRWLAASVRTGHECRFEPAD